MSFCGRSGIVGSTSINPNSLSTPPSIWMDAENVTGTDNGIITAVSNLAGGTEAGVYSTGVKFRGINVAGAEYGNDWDGWTGQTFFTWRNSTALSNEMSYFGSKGFNCFRLPISWERLQNNLLGSLDPTYQSNLLAYVNQATAANWAVIVDLHNYNRYATGAFSSPGVQSAGYTQRILGDGFLTNDHLIDVWTKLASLFIGNNKVIFNLMNEPHDFPVTSTNYFAMINDQVAAIRATGATNLILIPNSRGSDVDHWSTYSPNGGPLDSVAALDIVDPGNNYAYDMHAYQDNPSSSTSYATLITNVTNWARTNGKKLFLSEMGSSYTATNGAAGVGGALQYMNDNSDVWIGWTPWNLTPYALTQISPTQSYTADGPSMSWYTPYLTPNTVSTSAGTAINVIASIEPIWSVGQFKSTNKHSMYFSNVLMYWTAFNLSPGATFWCVVKYTSTDSTVTTAGSCPLTLFGYSSSTANTFNAGFSAGSPQYNYKISGVYNTYTSAITNCNDGNLHTVAFTHSTSNQLLIYVDGALTDSFSVTYDPTSFANEVGAGQAVTDQFVGNVAEAMVFRGVLSHQEIKLLHTRATGLWV